MPRNYVRKSLRATAYTQKDLQLAIERVRSNELSNYAASKIYGIPSSTLNDRVRGRTAVASQTLGRPPLISANMEARLAKCLRTMEKWGWGLSRSEVIDIATEFLKKNKIKIPFGNDKLGADWFIAFRKRQKLSIKKPQPVEYLRKRMTDPFVVYNYFSLLKDTLKELKINDPHRIYNLDETSISLDPSKTKVVGGINQPCTRTTTGSGRENISVLTTVNAAGEKINPLIVFKGKFMYEQWMAMKKEEHDFEVGYAASRRGWMETDIFYNYMSKILIPSLGDKRPVLLIYDGHSTHVDDRVVSLALENHITILKLPAHTSHLLQPLDLAVFKSFKTIWDQKLVQWQRHNVGVKMRKHVFAEMFAEAWHKTSPNVIKSGFKKAGIYPFNSEVIPKEKYDPAAYKRWQKITSQKNLRTLKQLCIQAINKFMSISPSEAHNFINTCTENLVESSGDGSFEVLLLQKLVQHSDNKTPVKIKRVAKGADVVTRTFLEKQREIEKHTIQETKAQKLKSHSRKQSTPASRELPGPSGLLQKKSRTKKDVLTMSTIFHDREPSLPSGILDNKLGAKGSDNRRAITAKGKGVGKKTRTGKENLMMNIINESGCLSNFEDHEKSDLCVLNNITENKKLRAQNNKTESKFKKMVPQKNLKLEKKFMEIPTKRVKLSTSTSTSVSGEISSHSDSDLLDALSDNYSDSDVEKQTDILNDAAETPEIEIFKKEKNDKVVELHINPKKNEAPIEQDEKSESDAIDKNLQRLDKKVTILSSVKFRPENRVFLKTCGPFELIDKNFDISKNQKVRKEFKRDSIKKKLDEEGNVIDNEVDKMLFKYNIGDTVLTRYYTKDWKYYVGVIKNINLKTKLYHIGYYKTIGSKSNVKFILPRRQDNDFMLPEICIVKLVELRPINDNPVEYVLMNNEDDIYF